MVCLQYNISSMINNDMSNSLASCCEKNGCVRCSISLLLKKRNLQAGRNRKIDDKYFSTNKRIREKNAKTIYEEKSMRLKINGAY